MTQNGLESFIFMKPTPLEEERIRLSLLNLRNETGVTMAGIDKWRLYYPVVLQNVNVEPKGSQGALSASSSTTSLDNLIAAADERLTKE